MNEKEFDPKKLIGIAFLAITLVIFAALTAVDIYTGGQMKTISNAYTAITRGKYEDYKACFADGCGMSEKTFSAAREDYIKQWGEDFHLSAKFVSRSTRPEGYIVFADITVYNDDSHVTEQGDFIMTRQNGKWVIIN